MSTSKNKISLQLQERIPLEEILSNTDLIRNVELTPQIEMISDYASYRIRGFLDFSGEYESTRGEGQGTQPYLIEKGIFGGKKAKKIFYRIPVDISLPADRVDDEGVVMEIVSLDYEPVSTGHLLVTADIELAGIISEERPEDSRTADEPIVEKNAFWDRPGDYEFDTSHLEEEFAKQMKTELENKEVSMKDQEQAHEEGSKEFEVIQQQQESQDTARFHDQEEEDAFPFANREQEENEAVNHDHFNNEEAARELEEFVYEAQREEQVDLDTYVPAYSGESDVRVSISNRMREELEQEETRNAFAQNEEDYKEAQAKSVALLSQFLSNHEETMTQIKVCLVQPGETIEEIANRYSISTDELIKANHLDFGSSIGGKVLKVPVRKHR